MIISSDFTCRPSVWGSNSSPDKRCVLISTLISYNNKSPQLNKNIRAKGNRRCHLTYCVLDWYLFRSKLEHGNMSLIPPLTETGQTILRWRITTLGDNKQKALGKHVTWVFLVRTCKFMSVHKSSKTSKLFKNCLKMWGLCLCKQKTKICCYWWWNMPDFAAWIYSFHFLSQFVCS